MCEGPPARMLRDEDSQPDVPVAPEGSPRPPPAALAKGVSTDSFLPEAARASARDLCNETSVTMLVVWLQETKAELRAREAELDAARHEIAELREASARAHEQSRVEWVPPVIVGLGGNLTGALGWSLPMEFRLVLTVIGLALLLVGARMFSRPRRKG